MTVTTDVGGKCSISYLVNLNQLSKKHSTYKAVVLNGFLKLHAAGSGLRKTTPDLHILPEKSP